MALMHSETRDESESAAVGGQLCKNKVMSSEWRYPSENVLFFIYNEHLGALVLAS